jgi:hypothetical protein
MTLEGATGRVLDALEAAGVPHMLVGGLTANFYGIPRATQDADVVVQLDEADRLRRVADLLGSDFAIDPQPSFETITGNLRHVVRLPSTPFVVELFVLGDDAFQQERFRRRVVVRIPPIGERVCLPTPEDVVIQKIRWGRPKDLDDARDVLAVQGDILDMVYVEAWCDRHGTSERLRAVLAQIPPL